jgi:hypothetical protein
MDRLQNDMAQVHPMQLADEIPYFSEQHDQGGEKTRYYKLE